MLISENVKPSMNEFAELMRRTDELLNYDALQRQDYYVTRNGMPLEDDVKGALDECAKNTPFENTIVKISGQKFPDIIATKFYGVEVKSTKSNHWTSTGSSILESSRLPDVERIYLMFGNLGGHPIRFKSRPYEECLCEIAVTHMPRYRIDMTIGKENTIFSKMGIPYDTLRQMENPIEPVADYYRSQLKPGEKLWWASDTTEEAVSIKIRLWKTLSQEEKKHCIVYGCVNFPEIFAGNYDNYALWLTSQGIVDPHIRDQFSAGGKENIVLSSGQNVLFPAVFRRIKENKFLVLDRLALNDSTAAADDESVLIDPNIVRDKIRKWIFSVSEYLNTKIDSDTTIDALYTLLLK
jgi:hypothetical protein